MYRAGRCRLCELPHCVEDAQPDRNAGKVTIARQLFGSSSALRSRLLAKAVEHQVGNAPDVDLWYHAGEANRGTSPSG